MLTVSGMGRRTGSGVHVPRWFFRAQSGILYHSTPLDGVFPRSALERMLQGKRRTNGGPAALVLTASPDNGNGAGTVRPGEAIWYTAPAQVIDLIRRGEVSVESLQSVVAEVPESEALPFLADLGFILSKAEGSPQIVLLLSGELEPEAFDRIPPRRWQKSVLRHHTERARNEGSNKMAKRSDGYIESPDELRNRIKELVREIHDEADPDEMNEYKRFVKKHVSVFSRSYFTAYLVKQYLDGNTSRRPRTEDRPKSDDRSGRKKKERREEAPVVGNVAPEDRQTLFVSVGKNRRVYPKDFVALFAELDGVEGDDIGQIKILDNYSFVEVDQKVADQIIAAYDGYEFRGRKLTVNFARNKQE
jgi:hypothetical protein